MSMRLVRYATVSMLALGVAASTAHAAGLELPGQGTRAVGRGGAYAVLADNPTAIALNPGALTRLRGTTLYLSNNIFNASTTFTRQESGIPATTSHAFDPLAPVHNDRPLFFLGPMGIAATDFGLEEFTFALGVWGPNATGKKKFSRQGGQRYMVTDVDAKLFFVGGAVAWGKPDTFGIGVTLQYANAQQVQMRLMADGAPTQGADLSPYFSNTDVHATIDMSDDFAFTASVGAWWRPIDAIEVGVSGRVIPVYLNLEGDWWMDNDPEVSSWTEEQLSVTDSSASMDFVLPPKVRAGIRYRYLDGFREVFDVELDFVYEAWSMIESYDVDLDGQINLFAATEAPDVVIERRWKDTFSLRLGGTWNVLDVLGLSGGVFWESEAVPEGYEHLDFPSYDRFGLGLGIHGEAGPVTLGLAYMHIFEEDRQVDELDGKVYQLRPLAECPEGCDGYDGVPVNAGRHAGSYDILSASVQVAF